MDEIARLLESQLEDIGAEYMDAIRSEIPEFHDMPVAELELSAHGAMQSVATAIRMHREDRHGLPDDYRRLVGMLARMRAEARFPLHASVRTFEVGVQIVIKRILEQGGPRGLLDPLTVSRVLRLAFDLVSMGVAEFCEQHLAASDEMDRIAHGAVSEFIVDLVMGTTPEVVAPRAVVLGLDDGSAYCVTATLVEGDVWRLEEPVRRRIPGAAAARLSGRVLWGTIGSIGVLITQAEQERDATQAASVLDDLLAEYLPPEWRVVVAGTTRDGLDGIRAGFREASEVLGLARRTSLQGIVKPSDVVLFRLLAAAPNTAGELAARLDPIAALKDGDVLLDTVSEYLANDCNAQLTARTMHLHRNSLRYRLERIEKALDLRVDANRTLLQLALMARGQPQRSPHGRGVGSKRDERDLS